MRHTRLTNETPDYLEWIDGYNGVARHLPQNADFAIAAAADPPALRAHARARGWHNLRLLSCGDSTFKFDLGSEEWHLLDLTPQGRGDWYAELEYPPPAS
jgi:predicted dithiol-disulfide oxidoreductase (DUF899 family)